MEKDSKIISYEYKFKFDDNTEKVFEINLDEQTLDLIQEPKDSYPEWTELAFYKCDNCPFNENKTKYCPLSVSLIEVIDFLGSKISYTEVNMEIISKERTYLKRTSMANAGTSLIGIFMVSCGCPLLKKLRPMVRYHLPFASVDETFYRAMSMYLLAQFFVYKRGCVTE